MELINRKKFVFFWLGIGALSLIIVAFFPWRFQVNDDVLMMWLVSGAYTGTPESYAIFLHPLLSWGFSKVYSSFPSIYWYEFIWFFSIYLSFALLICRISKIKTSRLTIDPLAFFILLISLHFGIFPQFTYVAGFAAFAALVILTHNESDSPNALAFVLLALAIMIRWESAVLIFLGYLFYIFATREKICSLKFFRKFDKIILLFTILLGSKLIYEINSPYSDFLKFNRIRAAVIDHPVFYQEVKNKEIPEGSGLFFFSRWYFEDPGITEADLREKKRDLDTEFWSFDYTLESFVRLWEFQRIEAFKSFLILGILFFLFLTIKRSPFLLLFFVSWMLFFLIFNHFYLIHGRVNILFFLCLLFPVFRVDCIHFERRWVVIIALIFSVALGFHFFNFLKEAKGRAIMDSEFTALQNLLSPSIPLIVEGYSENKWRFKFSSLNPVPFISTGWISRSDFQKKALQRMGISSFAAIEKFAFITPTVNNEIVFPDYMNHAFGAFVQTDSVRTDNFILLQFEKIGG